MIDRRHVALALVAATGCSRDPAPPSPLPPAPVAVRAIDARPPVDARPPSDARPIDATGPVDAFTVPWQGADTIGVAPRAPDTVATYCRGRPACGAPIDKGSVWPAGWKARFFQDGDSCSAELAIGGATYIVDDLGPSCGAAAFGSYCEGRNAVVQAGPWLGIITTHPRVNPFEDTMPGKPADEELRICSTEHGLACSEPIAIGKLVCDPHAAGVSPGGDGLELAFAAARLDVKLAATSVRFTWMAGKHDDTLTPGTFTLARL